PHRGGCRLEGVALLDGLDGFLEERMSAAQSRTCPPGGHAALQQTPARPRDVALGRAAAEADCLAGVGDEPRQRSAGRLARGAGPPHSWSALSSGVSLISRRYESSELRARSARWQRVLSIGAHC